VEGDDHHQSYYKERAVEYYRTLALKAHHKDIGIDIFCGGMKQFHTPILQNLVLTNGGIVIMQKTFSPDELQDNLHMSLNQGIFLYYLCFIC
jgi:hypothetical protein